MASLIPKTEDQIRSWLTELSHSETGSIRLVNLFMCWQHKLVPEDQIRAFVNACSSATSVGAAEDVFRGVCMRDDGTQVLFFGLAEINKKGMRGNSRLSSTIKTETFHRFLLARTYKATPPGLVSKVLNPLPRTVDEEQEFAEELKKIVASPTWVEPGASLGKPFPFPAFCWFTLTRELLRLGYAKSTRGTMATLARDALGLIDSKDGEHRLDMNFNAQWLKKSPDLKVARPTFADGGNDRFAAVLDDATSKRNNSRAWGTTVHLGKLAKKRKNISGLRERVSSPIPISAKAFAVTYLGRVTNTRGLMVGVDDNAAFEARLRGSLSMSEIIELLVQVTIAK